METLTLIFPIIFVFLTIADILAYRRLRKNLALTAVILGDLVLVTRNQDTNDPAKIAAQTQLIKDVRGLLRMTGAA